MPAKKKKSRQSSAGKDQTLQREKERRKTDVKMRRFLLLFTVLLFAAASAAAYPTLTRRHLWSGHNALDPAVRRSLVSKVLPGTRGSILDRSGQPLAEQIPSYTLAANFDLRTEEEIKAQERNDERTKESKLAIAKQNGNYEQVLAAYEAAERDYVSPYIHSEEEAKSAAAALKSVLKDSVDQENLENLMITALRNGSTSQIELGAGTKRLDKDTRSAIEALKIPGISFIESVQRSYPSLKYGSNLIGEASYSEELGSLKGTYGLEQSLDSYLKATDGLMQYTQSSSLKMLPGSSVVLEESSNGSNVRLTLDAVLQNTVDEQVRKTWEDNKASKAWCIVMEVETGKILAYSTMPTPQINGTYEDPIANAVYEPGSVMKPLVYAMAVDAGVYPHNATYRAGSFAYKATETPLTITRVEDPYEATYPVIYDALGTDYGTLTFADGLAHSSNIAICELLANYLTPDLYEKYIDAFHLYEQTGTPYLPEAAENRMLQNTQTPIGYLNSGFGQGSSLTPLDLVQAFSAIFNDGQMMQPYIVDSISDSATGEKLQQFSPVTVGYPISKKAANEVVEMMEHVTDYGMTGDRFAIEGVDMAMKTGTGEIFDVEAGAYDKVNYTSSVIAAAPASDPKVMVYWGMVSANYLNYSEVPFQTIMQAALSAAAVNTGSAERQENTVEQWESYEMPALVNHSASYAAGRMEDKKVSLNILGDGTTIIDQFPAAGSVLNSNDTVLLMTEGQSIQMPNMIGWTRKDISAFWDLTGIPVSFEPPQGSGLVIWQSIPAGTPIDADSGIVVELAQKKDDS